jgi:hypothetical protein
MKTTKAPIDPIFVIAPQLKNAPASLFSSFRNFVNKSAKKPPHNIAKIQITGKSAMLNVSKERLQIAPTVAIGFKNNNAIIWSVFLCLAKFLSTFMILETANL